MASGTLSAMRLLSVTGTRPQFVKAAPLHAELAQHVDLVVADTGQHYDHELSQVFNEELGLGEPDVRLGVGSGTHAEQTAAMLVGIERAALELQPDAMLVYGDTNSTLAGALVAAKLGAAAGARGGRPALVRHAHARGGQPRRLRPPLAAAALPVGDRRRRTSRPRASCAASSSSAT